MANKKTKNEAQYFEDEIDLAPYINRFMSRKWIILGVTIIAAAAVYGISYFLPKRYQVNSSITFSGGETTTQEDGTAATIEEIVSPTYVVEMAGKFESSRKSESDTEGLLSMQVEGKTYPLSVQFVVADGVDKDLYHNDFLSYLNENSYVSAELEAEKESVSESIRDYETSISGLDEEIARVEDQIDTATTSDATLVASYAELISVRNTFVKEKLELEKHLASLQGFKFAVRPYYTNGGAPSFPVKWQNAAIAGVVVFIIASGVVMFRKEKIKKK